MIPILQAIQNEYKYLPEDALRRVCEITDIRPADITGVSTFYSQFRHKPVGEHIIHVCTGTACHVKGAELVHDAFRRELAIPENDDTDPNGQFTLQKVACLGCCTLASVVQIDQVTYGYVSTGTVPKVLLNFFSKDHEITEKKQAGQVDESGLVEIRVGLLSCCVAAGSGVVMERVESSLQELGAQAL